MNFVGIGRFFKISAPDGGRIFYYTGGVGFCVIYFFIYRSAITNSGSSFSSVEFVLHPINALKNSAAIIFFIILQISGIKDTGIKMDIL